MELINNIDETISFNENNIRIVGSYNEPWFVAKDICQILEIKDVSMALTKIPEKWKDTKVIGTLGGNQYMRIINEAGLYKLIMRSNKPISQKFQEVVCEEILPSLRKKGEYKIQSIIDRNKEQILKYQSEKIECECGMKVQRNYLKKHTLSEIHKLSLENKLLGNPAKDCIKIECECGHSVRNNYLKRHLNSGIHKTAMRLKMESISKESTE
jgi:prophage antirepressor-like protein